MRNSDCLALTGWRAMQGCAGTATATAVHASRAAGFQLPDEYHTPALGKVWRPGGVLADIDHRTDDEWETAQHEEAF